MCEHACFKRRGVPEDQYTRSVVQAALSFSFKPLSIYMTVELPHPHDLDCDQDQGSCFLRGLLLDEFYPSTVGLARRGNPDSLWTSGSHLHWLLWNIQDCS